MKQYLELVRRVLDEGERREDRTGTGTLSIFGAQTRYDLRQGFPLLTTKKVLWTGVVRELLWFLRGSTNIRDELTQHTPIWDAWADEHGELGPIYGHQWRNWGAAFVKHANDGHALLGVRQGPGIDQLQQAIELIRKDPTSRRIIVSAWNVADLPHMALPPCHALFQFYVGRDRLDMQLYQRSADVALGVPFNIASYALLLMLVAQECGLTPGVFIHTLGDAHIYLNHVDGLKLQLTREPLPPPRVEIAKKPLSEIAFEDIQLLDYQHHPFLKFEVSV
nr:Thymidylate synthase [uncultured bacterium]AIA11280.1 Thymidylate synthase [uncultured bacterium]